MEDLPGGIGALASGGVALRPTVPDDLPVLLDIRREPEVAAWWGPLGPLDEERDYLAGGLTIVVDGAVAGWLEVGEEDDPMYRHAAFDLFVGAGRRGRGVGRTVLRLAIDALVARGHHRFTIDPAVANAAAVRCYRAVGFRDVGVLRAYERAPDGTWRDGLLMDLLAGELRPATPAPPG